MRELITTIEFWVAVALAILIKLASSEGLTIFRAATSIGTGIGAALVFTLPVVGYFQLDPLTYMPATAALVAMTFEHLARQVLKLRLTDLIKAWRGK